MGNIEVEYCLIGSVWIGGRGGGVSGMWVGAQKERWKGKEDIIHL